MGCSTAVVGETVGISRASGEWAAACPCTCTACLAGCLVPSPCHTLPERVQNPAPSLVASTPQTGAASGGRPIHMRGPLAAVPLASTGKRAVESRGTVGWVRVRGDPHQPGCFISLYHRKSPSMSAGQRGDHCLVAVDQRSWGSHQEDETYIA